MEGEHEYEHGHGGYDHDTRAVWDNVTTKLLLDLVSYERTDKRTLGKEAWDRIQSRFHERIGHPYTQQQLKSKLAHLKKAYSVHNEDLMRTGLGRDPDSGGVTAPQGYWKNLDVSHINLSVIR